MLSVENPIQKKIYIFRSKEDIVQGILAINEKMTE